MYVQAFGFFKPVGCADALLSSPKQHAATNVATIRIVLMSAPQHFVVANFRAKFPADPVLARPPIGAVQTKKPRR